MMGTPVFNGQHFRGPAAALAHSKRRLGERGARAWNTHFSRQYSLLLFGVFLLVASALTRCTCYVQAGQTQHVSRRRLVQKVACSVPILAGGGLVGSGSVDAAEAGKQDAVSVVYNAPVGDDIRFIGAGGPYRQYFSEQNNIKVGYVKPGGEAAKSGVRVGDVLLQFNQPDYRGPILTAWSRQFGTGYANKNANEAIISYIDELRAEKGLVELLLRRTDALQPGDTAPAFELPAPDGSKVSLEDLFAGGKKRVVVFFRPGYRFSPDKAMLKSFQEAREKLEAAKTSVVSITTDDEFMQSSFVRGYGLTYPLLSDAGASVAKSFGAGAPQLSLGYVPNRMTFVIGSDRKIEQVFPLPWDGNRNDMENHVDEVLRIVGAEPLRDPNAPEPGSVAAYLAATR